MKQLYFMRHGQSEVNAAGIYGGSQPHIKLTQLGRKQAVLAGREFTGAPIDVIYASNLDRAQLTTKLFVEAAGYSDAIIVTDERLHEIDPGTMTGQRDQGFTKALKHMTSGDDPTSETPEQVFARVTSFLRDVEPLTRDKTVLVVAHAGVARVFQSLLTGVTLASISDTTIPNAEPFELPLDRLNEVVK
ncbi:histidine phosphatase family protein [Candidatus Saccharibacteria bacterium]|nr:histidine phosphatase family protein [Candidatus Saccharibacteria bacterium]